MTAPDAPPPAPYRAPDLAAECASLRAEVARLRAKPATEWQVERDGPGWCFSATAWMFVECCTVIGWCVLFVACGWRADVQRLAAVVVGSALLWALAFVRRVPAEGSAR